LDDLLIFNLDSSLLFFLPSEVNLLFINPLWHRKALYFVRCEMRPRKYYLKTTTKRKKLNVKVVPIRASPRLPAGKWTLSIDS